MALFGSFGPLVNSLFGVTAGLPGAVGGFGQIGTAVVQSLAPASGPVIGQVAAAGVRSPMGRRVAGLLGGARGVVSAAVTATLIKIASTLGRSSMSVRGAIKIVRRMGRFLQPLAIATALGITVAELGELILAGANMPRRRMNPGNTSALRRAARRIESFHRLCVRTDQLRSPRRRAAKRHGPAAHGQIVQVK